MRRKFGYRSAAYWLLTTVCLRYGSVIPSVWLRRRNCNLLRLSRFGFDYPLNSCSFLCAYLSRVDAWRMPLFTGAAPDRTGRLLPWKRLPGVSDILLQVVAFRSPAAAILATLAVSVCDPVRGRHRVFQALSLRLLNWPRNPHVCRVRLGQRGIDNSFRNAVLATHVSRWHRCGILQRTFQSSERIRSRLWITAEEQSVSHRCLAPTILVSGGMRMWSMS